jgi:protein-S-isoprenylcysteine O-methyltransferase Ste14
MKLYYQSFAPGFVEMILASAPLIALCWITFYVVWVTAALFTKRTVERAAWWNSWWIVLPVAAVMFSMRHAILSAASARLWPVTLALGIVADAVTVIGLLITLWARRALGTNWSANVVFKERHELVEGGPYRFVRHPIYSGVLLMLFGTMLVWGRIVGVVGFVVVMAGLSVKASLEERLLMKHFPEAYEQYRRRVRAAIIPFVI